MPTTPAASGGAGKVISGHGVLRSVLTALTVLQLVNYGSFGCMAAAALFIFWVSYENLHGLLWFNTQAENPKSRFWLSGGEHYAAQWVARNAGPDDIVATNVHCENVKTPPADCISRSFWVSAMTERAVVLEGWAYQPAAMTQHGVNNLP